ncbi:MAG: hypothetical protein OXU75_15315 [Deltaproteobacteria bacterium]|nr:hypothetical protein [Deltaproteobacteria bacterium]
MEQRHFGLTEAIAESYTEAASVCMDRHHKSPTDFHLDSSGARSTTVVEWQVSNARVRRAWANETDTTEAGAYACILAAVELSNGLVAVRRAETETGADYYVAPKGRTQSDLEECWRLEVSGVDRGPEDTVMQRLRTKLAQAARGHSNLPALAGVVGFRARLILLAKL